MLDANLCWQTRGDGAALHSQAPSLFTAKIHAGKDKRKNKTRDGASFLLEIRPAPFGEEKENFVLISPLLWFLLTL